MSHTYIEPVAPGEQLGTGGSRPRARGLWLRRAALILVALWLAAEGASLAMQYTRLHRILTGQIEAAMGRPVKVGSYRFSFWDGAVIEAYSVTVGEDPRFGSEYFLRADSMAVRLRWRSLLRGHVEFGTLSLNQPSLNLVRNAQGDWNLAEWLPRPEASPSTRAFFGPVAPSRATHFQRIEIEGGRVNFKLGDEKLPFAFTQVNGTVETDRPGRWHLNLRATPWRAAVQLQEAGIIQVSGELGGTSSRLRPAALNVNWSEASLPDVLRLVHDDDFGLRGVLSLSLDAHTDESGDGWAIKSRAQLQQIHRWDLAQRADNPALNLHAQGNWRPSAPYVELTEATVEGPHSRMHAHGRLYWGRELLPARRGVTLAQVVNSSAEVDMGDLLPWARAFYSGIGENLSARGLVRVNTVLSGWPPRAVSATVLSEGIDISGNALSEPLRVGPLRVRYDRGAVSLAPAIVSWGAVSGHDSGSFHIESPPRPNDRARLVWHISGSTNQARDLVRAAGAFGFNISRGWDLTGPLSCDLRWQPAPGAALAETIRQPDGWMEFGAPSSPVIEGAALHAPFLNLPIEQIKARVDLKAGGRQIKLLSAQAFGARWTGSFTRPDANELWRFNLSADRLSTTNLDRWLNPRWRESFLDRVLPFLSAHSGVAAAPENLQANGRISVDHFALTPLDLSRLQSDVAIRGRHILLTQATAQFYGGQAGGSFDANLDSPPSYRANVTLSRVNLSDLTSESPRLAGLLGGTASADVSLQTTGSTRADLISNLMCRGTSILFAPELKTISLAESLRNGRLRDGSDRFSGGRATFTCANRIITFQSLGFAYVDSGIEGSGTVDFGGKLDLRLQRYSAIANITTTDHSSRVSGSLATPEITAISSATSRRGR